MRTVGPQDPAVTYAAVLDALPIVAFMADPSGVVTYVSSGWEQFTGAPIGVMLAAGYQAVIHPQDRSRAATTWDRARADETSYRDEYRVRIADGSHRWVLSQAEPMRGYAGLIVGWFGTLTDIQHLREVEDAMTRALDAAAASAEEAEARANFVERLLDASADCVLVIDGDARVMSVSAGGVKALAPLDAVPIDGADWLSFWAGADADNARAAVTAAIGGKTGRFSGTSPIGERGLHWDVTVTRIWGTREARQLLVVMRDVTESARARAAIERSEARYRILSETLPGVVWSARPDGRLDHISEDLSDDNRLPVEQRVGDQWLTIVHPDDVDRVRARWSACIASGAPYDIQFRVRMRDESYRWQLVRASAQRDADGTILRWVGVNVDIDDQRRADEAREQFVRLVEASSDFIALGDMHGNATYVNAAGRALLGLGSPDDVRSTHIMEYFLPEDRAFVEAEILPAIARDGRWSGDFRLRNFATGEGIPFSYNAFQLTDDVGRPNGVAAVSRDLRERYRVDAGMRALADTGSLMFRSLNFQETLINVAAAVTRGFATYCIIDLIDDEGVLRRVAASHSDPNLQPALDNAAAGRTISGDHPVARALREGVATLVETTQDWHAISGMAPGVEDDVRNLAPHAFICVPIVAEADHIVGAMSYVVDRRDSRGGYVESDITFAQEIALRAGVAFTHARAYERERRIAVTLQEASLPQTLPTIDGLSLSADYRPGSGEAGIGGDWYDAFVLSDGRIALTIGDVLGHGLNAAVTMGKLRQAMRSAAYLAPTPNAMLDVADATVRDVSADTYATAIAGIFDPKTHEFVFASAGHPGPAMRHGDGRVEEFSASGVLLGLREPGSTDTVTIAAAPGSALVFFTDGLTEATRDITEGHRRLHAAIAGVSAAAAQNPARALVDAVLRDEPAGDDIAVLFAEVVSSPC
jgi:PAS domain S-box-containing protein